MTNFVLDTNVFNRVLDNKLSIEQLPPGRFFITHVQRDELDKTKDVVRRHALQEVLEAVDPARIPTASAIPGIALPGEATPSDGNLHSRLRGALDVLNKAKPNNVYDALIGEVGIVHGFTLITADRDLAKVVNEHGGETLLIS